MLEREFQPLLKKELERRLPGCTILKQDPNQLQGVPDLLVLFEDKWALLETKRKAAAARRPNQEYWVEKFDQMSFSAFVNPSNMNEVLDELQAAFRGGR